MTIAYTPRLWQRNVNRLGMALRRAAVLPPGEPMDVGPRNVFDFCDGCRVVLLRIRTDDGDFVHASACMMGGERLWMLQHSKHPGMQFVALAALRVARLLNLGDGALGMPQQQPLEIGQLGETREAAVPYWVVPYGVVKKACFL